MKTGIIEKTFQWTLFIANLAVAMIELITKSYAFAMFNGMAGLLLAAIMFPEIRENLGKPL